MNTVQEHTLTDVAEMRRAFDESFSHAPALAAVEQEDFLGIQVAGAHYALRLLETARLCARPRILPLPAPHPEFLGLAGLQGELVPIYSLAALLGHGSEPEEARWVVLCSKTERLGLAFGGLDGYLRAPRTEVCALGAAERAAEFVQEALHSEGRVRPIVRVSAIVAALHQRLASGAGSGGVV